jgi:hypothetical protein
MNEGVLRVPTIITTKDQTVLRMARVKFSFGLWLKNFGRRDWDPDGPRRFGFGLGRYEVFEPFSIPKGSSFRLFELAIVDMNVDRLLAAPGNLGPNLKWTKIRTSALGPKFEYVEVAG